MIKIIKKIIMLSVLLSVIGVGSVGNAHSYESLPVQNLSKHLTVHAGDQQLLWAEESKFSPWQWMIRNGVIHPEVYQIRYKDKEDYRYAVAIKGSLGGIALQNLLLRADRHVGKVSLTELADILNGIWQEYDKKLIDVKQLFQWDSKQRKFVAILEKKFAGKNIVYRDVVHLYLYEDRYFGPTFLAIIMNSDDQKVMWPLLQPLTKLKSK